MIDFKIQVIRALSGAAPELPLSEQDFPEGVCGTLRDYDGNQISLPEGLATLVLTDDAALALSLLKSREDRLHVVFVGDAEVGAKLAPPPDDIWNAAESGELLRRRFVRLITALKNEYDLWFYKHALLDTIDTVPDMLWYKRADGIHMLVNDAFTKIVHKSKRDVHGKDHFYIWDAPRPTEDEGDFACAESEAIAISSGKMYVCEEAVKASEGMKQFTTYKTPLYDMFGNVFGTVGVGHDITNFSNLGIQLSILIENLPYPMCIFTPDWKVVRMNSPFASLAGVVTDEDRDHFDYHAWKDARFLLVGDVVKDSARRSVFGEYQLHLGDEAKSFFITELEIQNCFGEVTGYFSTIEDVTYRRAYEQSILDAANTDILTGLYNRRYFDNFVRGNTGKPFYLLYMDLDRFKAINDAYGHNVGDEVLIEVAELIREFFPRMVTARLGGDEFVVVDEDHDLAYIEHRCEIFENSVFTALKKYGSGASVSIGVAQADGTAEGIERALRESDERMYEVKKQHHANKL